MAKQKNSKLDYRAAKKLLNKFHRFSFPMPRKGKDFTPQQKSAITRQMNKLGDAIKNIDAGEFTFIKGKKLDDGMVTNKGTIYHYPKVEVKKPKKYKRYKLKPVEVKFGKRRELFFAFPGTVGKSIERIENFVKFLEKKYRPDYIRWAYKNMRESEVYNPDSYRLYTSMDDTDLDFDLMLKAIKERIGVYLGWRPDL